MVLALDWDFSEHITDVTEESFRIARSRGEVGTIVADRNVQEIDVTYHVDYETAVSFIKPFRNLTHVDCYIVNRDMVRTHAQ
jgi:hypothetical protein